MGWCNKTFYSSMMLQKNKLECLSICHCLNNFVRFKHSSLFYRNVTDESNKFYSIDTLGWCNKTFSSSMTLQKNKLVFVNLSLEYYIIRALIILSGSNTSLFCRYVTDESSLIALTPWVDVIRLFIHQWCHRKIS